MLLETVSCRDLAVAEFSAPWGNRALKTTGDLSKDHLRIATFFNSLNIGQTWRNRARTCFTLMAQEPVPIYLLP